MKRQVFINNPFTHMQKITVTTLRIVCNFNYVKLLSPICFFLFCLSCGNKNETEFDGHSLAGTKWKLAGIVDTDTGILKVLEPKDCAECYTFTFDTDSTGTVLSIWAIYKMNLLRLDLDMHRSACSPDNADPRPDMGPCLDAEAKDGKLYEDSQDFRKGIELTRSYEFTHNELKFFYDHLENHYILLFKPFIRM